MFRSKNRTELIHLTQEEYDKVTKSFYDLGYQLGQVEQRNRDWTSQSSNLSFAEKQVLVILEREGF